MTGKAAPYKITGLHPTAGAFTRYPKSLEALVQQKERWFQAGFTQISLFTWKDGHYHHGVDLADLAPYLPDVDPVDMYQYGE